MQTSIILDQQQLPQDPEWLGRQPCPVIACGDVLAPANADVVVADHRAAAVLAERIALYPLAAMTLVQVLRSALTLPVAQALDVESLAYSTLQSGPEFRAWRASYTAPPVTASDSGEAIAMRREGDCISAELNRPGTRNAISIEMRDALVELLTIAQFDPQVKTIHIRGRGACFSSGGALPEFGSAPDGATAHWVRSVHSPARLLAQLGGRIECYVHGACIGSGLELPVFADRVIAHRKTFFHLPELSLGLIPGAGGTVSISRRIGRHRTAWMVLSGRRINADTALEWGLVDALSDD